MSAKANKRGTRRFLHAATVIALLAGSAYLTVELRKDEQAKAPAVQAITDTPDLTSAGDARNGEQKWERLKNPERSVLRSGKGAVLATFTDGARTATLTGPSRTFSEPTSTKSRVVTENWVRLMPEPWKKDAEKEQWFKDWFEEFYGSEEDDLFAYAFQYVQGAPVKEDGEGTPTRVTRTSARSTPRAAWARTTGWSSRTSTTTWAFRTPSATAPPSSRSRSATAPSTARASSGRSSATGAASR